MTSSSLPTEPCDGSTDRVTTTKPCDTRLSRPYRWHRPACLLLRVPRQLTTFAPLAWETHYVSFIDKFNLCWKYPSFFHRDGIHPNGLGSWSLTEYISYSIWTSPSYWLVHIACSHLATSVHHKQVFRIPINHTGSPMWPGGLHMTFPIVSATASTRIPLNIPVRITTLRPCPGKGQHRYGARVICSFA